jgi:predicted HicB family RNase H-like nuclease
MNKHAISIKWSDEDESFVATIPGIKALSALGTTREEALSELRIVAEAYFESLRGAGKPMPLPEKVIPFSGQLRLRMPKSLHAALSNEAEHENVSLNTYLVSLLSERHTERNLLNKIEGAFSSFHNRSQTTYKIGERDTKYRRKNHKK